LEQARVGGPADPAGCVRLRAAQVVLHDDLVPAEILELCALRE